MAGPMQSDTADYSDAGGTFGSGLSFGGAGEASAGPMAPGADVPPAPVVEPMQTADTPDNSGVQAPKADSGGLFGNRGGLFGSGIKFGAQYTTPDPAMSALDQSADLLTQRVKRANEIATNPIAQFFNPEAVQKARDFAPQAAEALQKIKGQQAAIVAGRQQAETLGFKPGEVADEATDANRMEAAKAKALAGDLKTLQGIKVVDPKTYEVILPQVIEKVGSHLNNAQLAFDSLSGMPNQGQYAAKLAELRNNGTLSELEGLGLKVPPTMDGFSAGKAQGGQILREARINLNNTRNSIEARNTYQPMEKNEAETYAGSWKTVYGDDIKTQASRNATTNARAGIVDGYDDPRKLGKGTVLATPDQRKSIKEDAELAVPKADLEKLRANNRTYKMAITDSKGEVIPPEGKLNSKGERIFINDNPNVQQGIAEGLASALRGGQGGANVGLLKIETSKRGYIQGLLDNISTNYGGAINTIQGEQVKKYLTTLTQREQRDVLDFLKGYNEGDIPDRLATTAKRAGALGLDAAALGIGKDEAGATLNGHIEEGRQAQIALDMQRHIPIGGGRGALSYGALKPTEGAAPLPAGAEPATAVPGTTTPTPVQQNAGPPAPATGTPTAPPATPSPGGTPAGPSGVPAGMSPAGGPAAPPTPPTSGPITIAGQQVNAPPLPPGASPDYLRKTQRIESGREKDPWKAGAGNGPDGKPLSSAKGAFQFINSTWAADKPPGAPDNPANATPQQQADAAAARATKNAASLTKAGIPVNDTNLYITHNLGEGAGPKLLNADPGADARTVVGEKAAKNNPLFFRGKPTVATVLARYDAEMNALDDGPKPKPGAGGATAEQPPTFMQRIASTTKGMSGTNDAETFSDANKKQMTENAAVAAPAALSTIGAVGGGIVGGPAGAVGGGAVGGGAGQVVQDYLRGNKQNPTEIAKQTLLGGVLGVASEARPFIAGAARVMGSGAVEGGAKAIEGGDVDDIAMATAKGGGLALGGEVLGKFITALGPAAHKLFSKFTPDAQAELSAQAGKLVEARKVLASEQPKLGGEAGGPNPKFDAAKKAEEDATQYIKDHGQKPDDMAYAYEQVNHPGGAVSAGEAKVLRKAANEKAEVSAGYDKLRQDVREATPGQKNLKPQSVPNGPTSMLRTGDNPTGKVPEAFRPQAEHAEMLVTAPAKDWGMKWQQLQDAGSELIKQRMAFLANNDKPSADAMNQLFEGVRNQQKAAAKIVFGEKRGAEVIAHLENLDTRYAKVMNATQGMNYEKMRATLAEGNTPARRDLEANFKEFAKDDPSAIRAFNAMKAGAKGDWKTEAALMTPIIAGEISGFIPTLGAVTAAVGGAKLYGIVRGYMNAKMLGKPVTFKDFLADEIKTNPAMLAAADAARRGAVMQ